MRQGANGCSVLALKCVVAAAVKISSNATAHLDFEFMLVAASTPAGKLAKVPTVEVEDR